MGRKIGAVSFLEILAPELNDRSEYEFWSYRPELKWGPHFSAGTCCDATGSGQLVEKRPAREKSRQAAIHKGSKQEERESR
jgi:hypothetical protein